MAELPSQGPGHDVRSAVRDAVRSPVHYTAFIRLPFPRGDFEDPPPVDWTAEKDQALWQVLSRNPRSADLNWKELARQFHVTVPFILQQAAWLYERQLSSVRAQMRRASRDDGSAPVQADDEAPRKLSQAPPALDGTSHAAPGGNALTRTPSASAQPMARTQSNMAGVRAKTSLTFATAPTSRPSSSSSSSSSSASSSDGDTSRGPSRPRPFKRPSRFSAGKVPLYRSSRHDGDEQEEEEEEDAPAFLPLRNATDGSAATVRGEEASSKARAAPPEATRKADPAVSPPVGKRGLAKDASDGTPSMGSSFSDLDDTSVTQSALEEALLSNMQRGAGASIASRLSMMSRAATKASPDERRDSTGKNWK